jgi:hypothetical protein
MVAEVVYFGPSLIFPTVAAILRLVDQTLFPMASMTDEGPEAEEVDLFVDMAEEAAEAGVPCCPEPEEAAGPGCIAVADYP